MAETFQNNTRGPTAATADSPERPAPRRHHSSYELASSSQSRSGTDLLAAVASDLEIPTNLTDTEAAAARFDASPFRLWLLFHAVDSNRDGFIDKEELIKALLTASSSMNGSNAGSAKDLTTRETSSKAKRQLESKKSDGETDEDGLEDVLFMCEIQALDELWDRIVGETEEDTTEGDNQVSETKNEEIDEADDKTDTHRNFPLPTTEKPAPRGITFPQFSRIIRYLWLEQLLNPNLDDPLETKHHDYKFECIDYAEGYHRRRTLSGAVSDAKSHRFFNAPRHGYARMRWIDVPSGTFVSGRSSWYRQQYNQVPDFQRDAFRMTILRLAVKYRFHPTSIEDAIDLKEQEPKVNYFAHSLLECGNYHCRTIPWLRFGGDTQASSDGSTIGRTSHTGMRIPMPTPGIRQSSTDSFNSYHNEDSLNFDNPPPPFFPQQRQYPNRPPHSHSVPSFVIAEENDDAAVGYGEDQGYHYFITIPLFELSRRAQTSLDLYAEASDLIPSLQLEPLVIEVNEAALGMFVASQPDPNIVVTCSTKWWPTRIKPISSQEGLQPNQNKAKHRNLKKQGFSGLYRSPNKTPPAELIFDDDGDDMNNNSVQSWSKDEGDDYIEGILQDEKSALERVKRILQKRYAIQRHRNSSWLMHAILDAVVDNLSPISRVYEAQLQRMSTQLFELQHRLSKRDVKEMIVMRRDLDWLQHELRPFARVLRHLIDDQNIGAEVTHYLEDVEDHLLRTLEELASHARECVSLKDEYNAYVDRRTNDLLFVLALVTVLVVPGQFFVGYFGMNFTREDGTLGDPLLNLGGMGVAIFWAMTILAMSTVTYIMYSCNFFERHAG